MHFIARTQKILTFMSWMGECRQQKHTQQAPSTKTECDYLNGWIKKRSHTQKISPKSGEPQRYSWGTQNKKQKQKKNPHSIKSVSRVSDQIGIFLQRYIVGIYHSGRKPSIFSRGALRSGYVPSFHIAQSLYSLEARYTVSMFLHST